MTDPVTFLNEPPSEPAQPDAGSGDGANTQLTEAIEAIRPALQMDGGDINLVGFDPSTGVVEVELVGACGSCPASVMTLQAGIERILKDRVDGVTEVKPVGVDPALG
jgi:Fe-S cluster biogenesis protein NfuA